jgi:DNA-binding response OmpR family regulator
MTRFLARFETRWPGGVSTRPTLRSLAKAHASEMKLMEQMSSLLHEELTLDATIFWRTHGPPLGSMRSDHPLRIDHVRLTVRFRDKSCFLGNTLPFRLVDYLARHLNTYLTYTDLLKNVWECRCTA